jgi:predicted thioesterase
MDELKAGLTGVLKIFVEEKDLATHYGNPGVEVLSTPRVAALVEEAAIMAVKEHLPEGSVTLGGWLELSHQAPTPLGMGVTVTALLAEVDGRKLRFEVAVSDEVEKVAEAKHLRIVVDLALFNGKVAEKGVGGN